MNEFEILLGDNPFFGIDHLTQERARKRMEKLNNSDEIINRIQYISNLGIKGFVVSTHPELKEIIKCMKTKTNLIENLDFYPIIPYAQGYVSKVTEKGVVGTLNEVLSAGTLQDKFNIFFKGAIGVVKKDHKQLFKIFIDIELLPLKNTKMKVVFLHDVITDVAISLNMKEFIITFIEHVTKKYNCKVGVVTKNLPKLQKTFSEWGIEIPNIMANFNSIGYQMNPSKKLCEESLIGNKSKIFAMNTLAGGHVTPKIAAQYISQLNIDYAVIGMSNKEHAKETINEFSKIE